MNPFQLDEGEPNKNNRDRVRIGTNTDVQKYWGTPWAPRAAYCMPGIMLSSKGLDIKHRVWYLGHFTLSKININIGLYIYYTCTENVCYHIW